MYNKYLKVFLQAADLGSFSKAAEKLYVSPNAVIKQVNHLEEHLGLRLFRRTPRGLTLTREGERLYMAARYIISYSEETLRTIRQDAERDKNTIRIGVGIFNHPAGYMRSIRALKQRRPELNIEIHRLNETEDPNRRDYEALWQGIDLYFGTYSEAKMSHLTSTHFLRHSELCLAVSINHPLALRDEVRLEELRGERIYMVNRGVSEEIDALRDEMERCGEIEIINIEGVTTETFNTCDRTGGIMLSVDIWGSAHPMLARVKLADAHHAVTYGIVYPLHAEQKILDFIAAIQ